MRHSTMCSVRSGLLGLFVVVGFAVCLPLRGGGEDAAATRYPSQGSPFGIQDLVETRIGDYADVVEAGVRWIRLEGLNGLNWARVEEQAGVFDWGRTDRLVRDLVNEGFHILWTVSSFHPSSGRIHFLPEDMDGYLAFLSAAVERYDGDGVSDAPGSPVVATFQIENEVDGHFWEDTSANYALLLKKSISTIKEANSEAKVVIAGASTPEGYYRFYPEILSEFGERDEWFDVMDIHWYESVGDYAVHPSANVSLVEFLEDVRRASENVEIWFTEVGTHSGADVDPRKPAQTETEQAVELVKRYAHFVGNGVARVFWHTMLESRAYSKAMKQNDFFDNIGLIYNGYAYMNGGAVYRADGVADDLGDGVRKLAYYSYKLMAERLAEYEWVEAVQQGDGEYAYRFRVGGSDAWVVWVEAGGTISLPAPGAERIRVTDAVPQTASGQQVNEQDYLAFFDARIVDVEAGVAELTLGELPVLVEVHPAT